jgi:catechol 2,3-dioxygenase-like lactoylglutathione lyase family enzyme
MIGYVTIGTNDIARAAPFYDAVLGFFGAQRWMENERLIAWSAGQDKPGIGICKPFDGNAATVGNGMMVSLPASDPEQVNAIHARALELGGTDEGAPGFRFGEFYGAYFRDLDGNKLCAFCMVPGGESAG